MDFQTGANIQGLAEGQGMGAASGELRRRPSDATDGNANGAERRVRALGWFRVGLGLAQLAWPRQVARAAAGMPASPGTLRALGLRELACGAMLLTGRAPAGWLWARVAGDLMDLAMLGSALRSRKSDRSRVLASMAAVAAVTTLDVATSIQLGRRARTGATARGASQAIRAATVNRPPEDVYRFWRNFHHLPRFMANLESVQLLDDRRSHWIARLPGGKKVEWDAELVTDRPNQLISWRSLPGSRAPNAGSVEFRAAPGGRGTEVRVEIRYDRPGLLPRSAARLLSKGLEEQVAGDLRRFKQILETGEVVHSDSSIHQGRHPARPSDERSGGGRR
jgi:uncharacterized membrane protein